MADQDREAEVGNEGVELEPKTETQGDLDLDASDAESVKGGGGGVPGSPTQKVYKIV